MKSQQKLFSFVTRHQLKPENNGQFFRSERSFRRLQSFPQKSRKINSIKDALNYRVTITVEEN